jgi:hypothetical protein
MSEMPALVFSVVFEHELLFKSIIFLIVPKNICRIINTKYNFYIDVLDFHMKVIEWRLAKKQMNVCDIKVLRKCYTLCWKMCIAIENIFGWEMCIVAALKFLSGVFCGYILCIEYTNGHFILSPVIPVLVHIVAAFVLTNSCQKCIDCSSSIASLIFKFTLKKFTKSN